VCAEVPRLIVACVPAYNEEKTIAKVVLGAQRHVDVVVVCDDGSDDLTAEIARRMGATVIRHGENLGYGAAVQSLFKKARQLKADVMVTLDADAQHDAGEIPKLVQPILDGGADIVVGSRFLGEQVNDLPAYRRFGIKVITKLSGGGSSKAGGVSDAQSGFRAYSKKAVQALILFDEGMGVSAEILLKAKEKGLKLAEVPVGVHYEGLDTSTHHPLRHGGSVIMSIVKLVVEERPLFYLGIPGIVFIFFGAIFGLWVFDLYRTGGYIVTNVALAAIAFLLTGFFVTSTAITLYAVKVSAIRVAQKEYEKKQRD